MDDFSSFYKKGGILTYEYSLLRPDYTHMQFRLACKWCMDDFGFGGNTAWNVRNKVDRQCYVRGFDFFSMKSCFLETVFQKKRLGM